MTTTPVPATITALLSTLKAESDTLRAPAWFDHDEARGYANGVEFAADLLHRFVAEHPGQFQSFTAEQRDAIADVTHYALGYRQSRGQSIDPRKAANLLWAIVDPEGGVPAMAPYLTFRVTLAADGSPAIATFDSLDDARTFAEMKSAQGERHVVRS